MTSRRRSLVDASRQLSNGLGRLNRRTMLKGMGATAALSGMSSCVGLRPGPSNVTTELLRERIQHVVVVMMENRSFDHVFGTLSLLEGRTDVDGLTPAMSNPLQDGTPLPPALADAQCVADPGHGWNASHNQWNGGQNDGFVRVHENSYGTDEAHRVMGYLDRSMQPVSYALADEYALCQRWFCSVMGPTWPNRYYSFLASSNGNDGNIPIADALPSLWLRLDEAGIHWKNYYGNIPFSILLPGHSIDQSEYQKLDVFLDDVDAGELPPYTLIDPTYGKNDDHPPAHPMAGQILLSTIYTALARSRLWSSTMLVVTYDEHGGFFDHVPPPTTADARTDFQQMGFRVPGLVVGGYVKQQVSSTVFDHTSIVASMLRLHELEPLNERDDAANDWWGLLDEQRVLDENPAPPIELPVIDVDEETLFVPECRGLGLGHLAPGQGSLTGQPELEAFFEAQYGTHHDKDGRRDQEEVWRRILARAERMGVVRRRP